MIDYCAYCGNSLRIDPRRGRVHEDPLKEEDHRPILSEQMTKVKKRTALLAASMKDWKTNGGGVVTERR